jgi:ankyrin repeat protein
MDVCEFLLSKGADRSYRDKNGLTAFEMARTSPQSNAAVLKMCQPEGEKDMTVHNAALLGETTFLRNLIAKGVDVNGYDSLAGKTPLALAAEAGHVEACRILVEAGADVEKGAQIKKTFPMVLAVQAGQTNVVQYFCAKASDRQVAEAFYAAFLCKRPDIAAAIIEWTKDASALYRNAQEQIDSLLRAGDKGVYSLLRHKDVALPLWAAAGVGDTNVVKKAIDVGDDVEQVGSDFWGARGETPLLAAVVNGQYEVVRMLLAAGANPNRVLPRSGSSYTPLFSAVEIGDERLVDLLLKSKADVNATNHLGCTPLFIAVRKDRVTIVRVLLESGADPNNIPVLRSKDGKMSSLLSQTSDKGISQLLRNHGAR